ncbi:primosomal protein N' [Candidatus Gracilibacteria bacterium]|nr:primosomal protein N' [Candidatus Gracilibacteria bacterium]
MFLVNLSQDQSKINQYLSNTLLEKIEDSFKKHKKIILYLNKRGEYSSLICNNCNFLYKCPNCDISMSVHKYPEKIICHICNLTTDIPKKCHKCNKEALQKVGIGTQQIEQTLKELYPKKNVFRFDTDVVKNKTEKSKALENLEKADIIIGTKMITTGFNFKKIGLIGIILLEQELLTPKYNTEEKVYSNIKQLIGRGNRNGEKTNILIQTFIPENEIIKSITESNYKEFFIKTLEERKHFNYPPYTQMLSLEYRNINKQKAKDFIDKLKVKLETHNSLLNSLPLQGKEITKIEIISVPNPSKRHNQYYYKLILKGHNLRGFIECIKSDIMRNSGLVVIFE